MRRRLVTAVGLATVLLAASAVATLGPPDSGAAAAAISPQAAVHTAATGVAPNPASDHAAMLEAVNQARASARCPALHWDARLAKASAWHSADMVEREYFAHTNPGGQTPWDRAHQAGYDHFGAENIAAGSATFAATMDQWLRSPGHRRNIMDCRFVAMGVGEAEGGPMKHYWTQMLGYQ